MERVERLRRRFRISLAVFLIGLLASGATAFPLLREVEWLARVIGVPEQGVAGDDGVVRSWIATVRAGLREIHANYPFLAYGTDWLAFAHFAIAVFFLGPLVKPESGRWILAAGMIACGGVIVTALVCGAMRGIPVWWRMVDCSFGVFGFVPLLVCWRTQRELTENGGSMQ